MRKARQGRSWHWQGWRSWGWRGERGWRCQKEGTWGVPGSEALVPPKGEELELGVEEGLVEISGGEAVETSAGAEKGASGGAPESN